jgi:micrococcal nuclease
MHLKKLFPILLFSVLVVLFSCINYKVIVDYVVDGDTLKVYYGSNYESIRIIGIDTPEIHEGSKPVGEYGDEAKNYLENFVSKYSIYIKKIVENGEIMRDPYERILAYVFGEDENGNMIFYE